MAKGKCRHCGFDLPGGRLSGAHVTNCSENPRRLQIVKKISESLIKKSPVTLKCNVCLKMYTLEVTPIALDKGRYRKYCSPACSTSIGRRASKRNREEIARFGIDGRECGCGERKSRRSKRCRSCSKRKLLIASMQETLGGIKKKSKGRARHMFQGVRNNAHRVVSVLDVELLNSCRRAGCEYKVHAEIAHLREISSFLDSATIGEINDTKNLALLCRNCHWEYDNGLVENRDIVSIFDIAGVV